jgi:hypothetical protein
VTDEAPPTQGPVPHPASSEPAALGRAPLLAFLGTGAALLQTLIGRLVLPAFGARLRPTVASRLFEVSALLQNLAAVAAVVALTGGLVGLLRRGWTAGLFRRLTIAGFAGVFLPSMVIAALLPRPRTTPQLVVFATGAAHVLAVLVSVTASARRSGSRVVGRGETDRLTTADVALRIGCALLALGAGLGLLGVLLELAPVFARRAISQTFAAMLAYGWEACWAALPLVGAVALRPDLRTLRGRVGVVLAFGVGALVSLVLGLLRATLRNEFASVLYYAFRVRAVVEAAPLAYSLVFTLAVTVALAALFAAEAHTRQGGAAVLLLACAGAAPRTPLTLLFMVTGALLLARTALSRTAPIEPRETVAPAGVPAIAGAPDPLPAPAASPTAEPMAAPAPAAVSPHAQPSAPTLTTADPQAERDAPTLVAASAAEKPDAAAAPAPTTTAEPVAPPTANSQPEPRKLRDDIVGSG